MAKWRKYKAINGKIGYVCSSCHGNKTCGTHPNYPDLYLTGKYCLWCGNLMENWQECLKEQIKSGKGPKIQVYYDTEAENESRT